MSPWNEDECKLPQHIRVRHIEVVFQRADGNETIELCHVSVQTCDP